MTNKTLEYNGFQGSIELDTQTFEMHGKILHINDLVTYEAENPKELYNEFVAAVEDYLDTCRELGVEPEKPYSGSFNIRIGVHLHKDLAKFSARHNSSINEIVKDAINCHINGKHNEVHHHHYPESDYLSEIMVNTHKSNRPKLVVVQ